jgi:hypothetical protein
VAEAEAFQLVVELLEDVVHLVGRGSGVEVEHAVAWGDAAVGSYIISHGAYFPDLVEEVTGHAGEEVGQHGGGVP